MVPQSSPVQRPKSEPTLSSSLGPYVKRPDPPRGRSGRSPTYVTHFTRYFTG